MYKKFKTIFRGDTMTDNEFKKIFDDIVDVLREKGYDPFVQIAGYLETNIDAYITRHGDARNRIKLLDKEKLKGVIAEKPTIGDNL